jgi:hypothetical protein
VDCVCLGTSPSLARSGHLRLTAPAEQPLMRAVAAASADAPICFRGGTHRASGPPVSRGSQHQCFIFAMRAGRARIDQGQRKSSESDAQDERKKWPLNLSFCLPGNSTARHDRGTSSVGKCLSAKGISAATARRNQRVIKEVLSLWRVHTNSLPRIAYERGKGPVRTLYPLLGMLGFVALR